MAELILKIYYKLCLLFNGIIMRILLSKWKGRVLIDRGLRLYGVKNIRINGDFVCGKDLRMQSLNGGVIKVGFNNCWNDRVHIGSTERVEIGDNCLFASNILVTDHGHGSVRLNSRPVERELDAEPISIGNDVWIGENVIVYKGVTIGEGSIIGAGSFVNKSFPPYSIIVGSPARRIN